MIGWMVEIWDLPDVGSSRRLAALPSVDLQFQPTLGQDGTISFEIPSSTPNFDLILDPDNDEGSIALIFLTREGEDPVLVFSGTVMVSDDEYGEEGQVTVPFSGAGLTEILARTLLYPYDYDTNPSQTLFPNWIYGSSDNLLSNHDFTDNPDGLTNGDAEDLTTSGWQRRGTLVTGEDGFKAVENATNAYEGDGYWEVDPQAIHSGIQRSVEVYPGKRYQISAKLKEPAATGERFTLAATADKGYTLHSTGRFYQGEVLAELDGATPSGTGCPGGASDGTWQDLDIDLTVGSKQDSLNISVQYDQHSACSPTPTHPLFWIDAVTITGYGVGTDGWAPFETPTTFEIDQVTTFGTLPSLKFVPDSTYDGVDHDPVDLIVGGTYHARLWVDTDTAGCTFKLEVISESQGILGSHEMNALVGLWNYYAFTFDVPAGVTDARFRFTWVGGNTPGRVNVADAGLFPGKPAATAGEIWNDILTACNARGALSFLSTSFTTADDSNSDTWQEALSVELQHNQNLSHVRERLNAVGGIEHDVTWDEGLAQPVLHVYNPGGLGSDLSASVALIAGRGIRHGGPFQRRIPPATVVLAEGSDGVLAESTDAGKISAWGRRELSAQDSTATDAATVQLLADETLANALDAQVGGKVTYTPSPGAPIPFIDFGVGDTIAVDIPGKMTGAKRVVSIAPRFEDEVPVFDIDLGSQVFGAQASQSEAIRRLLTRFSPLPSGGGGAGGGLGVLYGDVSGTAPGPIKVVGFQTKRIAVGPSDGQGYFYSTEHDMFQLEQRVIPTYLVAASNAREAVQETADYLCDGTDDHVEIQAALDACDTLGWGRVVLSEGQFLIGGDVTIPGNVHLMGLGSGVTFFVNYGGVHIYYYASAALTGIGIVYIPLG